MWWSSWGLGKLYRSLLIRRQCNIRMLWLQDLSQKGTDYGTIDASDALEMVWVVKDFVNSACVNTSARRHAPRRTWVRFTITALERHDDQRRMSPYIEREETGWGCSCNSRRSDLHLWLSQYHTAIPRHTAHSIAVKSGSKSLHVKQATASVGSFHLSNYMYVHSLVGPVHGPMQKEAPPRRLHQEGGLKRRLGRYEIHLLPARGPLSVPTF